jgi:site-specific DNA-methyltransferase (adenine-specific)
MLDNFIDVMRCWGFEYSTVAFTWVKSTKNKTGFAFGLGNWTRSNAEICVLGRRGTIERQDASVSQIIYEPKEAHSKKPDIVRDKIVQLVGDLPRIELFARQKVEGWDSWGNEV